MLAQRYPLRHGRRRREVVDALLSQRVKPEVFCERWFGATPDDKESWGYRAKCVKLLSKVLGIRDSVISNQWGPGYTFEKMPPQHEVTLQYADIVRQMIQASAEAPDILDAVLERIGRKSKEANDD